MQPLRLVCHKHQWCGCGFECKLMYILVLFRPIFCTIHIRYTIAQGNTYIYRIHSRVTPEREYFFCHLVVLTSSYAIFDLFWQKLKLGEKVVESTKYAVKWQEGEDVSVLISVCARPEV